MCRLQNITPKKFLCKFSLKRGAYVVGVLFAIISIICILCTLSQAFYMQKCKECSGYAFRNSYGYSITAVIYCIIVLILSIWFIIGSKKEKISVVLSWVVISGLWLLHTFCLLIVLIFIYSSYTTLADWIACLVFGLLTIVILLYAWLVCAGYWLELKRTRSRIDNMNVS